MCKNNIYIEYRHTSKYSMHFHFHNIIHNIEHAAVQGLEHYAEHEIESFAEHEIEKVGISVIGAIL